MIVYRSAERRFQPRRELRELRDLLARGISDGERATDFLIRWGEFESGVTDALSPERDSFGKAERALREAALASGHVLRLAAEHRMAEASPWAARGQRALDTLAGLRLPAWASTSVPEGYAYYALYPETYLKAAEHFWDESRPARCVVLGIRSIGTSLSAAVAAALEDRGCEVHSWTVRPRGHPFERRLRLDTRSERELLALAGAHYAVVDEGPGLSGTSITCVAERLSELGISDHRIVFFPSWTPPGDAFVNKNARLRWRRHRKYAVSFDVCWPGDPERAALADLSGGRWRGLLYPDGVELPAVQPQHERRKYLEASSRKPVLMKFAGLGRYGRERLERAQRLAAAGFSPRTLGLEHGFLMTEFVEGRPLAEGDVCQALLVRMARYIAWMARECRAQRSVPFNELSEMIRVNAGEGLGEEWAGRAAALERLRAAVEDSRTTAVDSRMLPHEWLETARGFFKTDAVDHHDDHFFPGCQDIAWDVAGACAEFGLDPQARASFVERCASLAADAGLPARLPFYSVAYLAYRLGYVTLARTGLANAEESRRFARLEEEYRRRLRSEIVKATRPVAA